MKTKLILLYLSLICFKTFSQSVSITPSGIMPMPVAGSYPRISYEAILALPSPIKGDIAYDNTYNCLRVYTGNRWICTNQNQNSPSNIAPFAYAGGTGDDAAFAVKVDNNNNVYVVGTFENIITFGNIQLNSMGGADVFVVKYDNLGNVLWAKSGGGTGNDFCGAIDLDANNNVFITGYIAGNATFESTSLTSYGGFDILVVKYATNGNLAWAKNFGSSNNDNGNGVATDANGNVVVTGFYSNNCFFGSGNNVISYGDYDIFVVKYDTNGSMQWVQTAGGTMEDRGVAVATDGANNIYVTGSFTGNAAFGNILRNSVGGSDSFIMKINDLGTVVFSNAGGGSNQDKPTSIAIGNDGHIYISGSFVGGANYDGNTITSNGQEEGFFVKFNSVGSAIWAQSFGGTSNERGMGIAVDSDNNVYVTGYFSGSATFGNLYKKSSLTVNGGTNGDNDAFILKCNNSGTIQWVQALGGYSIEQTFGIAKSNSGVIYLSGLYQGYGVFPQTDITWIGNYDMFVARIDR